MVRHSGFLSSSTFFGTARLPVGAACSEAVRSGVGGRYVSVRECGGRPLPMTGLPHCSFVAGGRLLRGADSNDLKIHQVIPARDPLLE